MRIRKRSHSPLEKVCAVRVEPCIQFRFFFVVQFHLCIFSFAMSFFFERHIRYIYKGI